MANDYGYTDDGTVAVWTDLAASMMGHVQSQIERPDAFRPAGQQPVDGREASADWMLTALTAHMALCGDDDPYALAALAALPKQDVIETDGLELSVGS